jgi:hypothetical protein
MPRGDLFGVARSVPGHGGGIARAGSGRRSAVAIALPVQLEVPSPRLACVASEALGIGGT